MLVIIPTPIGNLKDISLRQYEALHSCDVLATEDTRTAGKLINLLKKLRLKDQTMTKFEPKSKQKSDEEAYEPNKKSIELIEKNREMQIKQNKSKELTFEQQEKIKTAVTEYYANKSLEIPTFKVDKEDIKELLTSTYFRKVLDSEDFDNRKKVLEYCQPIIEKRMVEVAKNYDKERKLSYIMKRKPEFEKDRSKTSDENGKEETYDEYQFIYGIDNEKVQEIKEHIAYTKKKKGRGLLVSVNAENEEKRIPRLMKMMKLGFRVGLLSEAGTPSISDPGAEFIRTAAEEGILIEALPGPCAGVVGLVASGLQQSGFVFHGFLPKGRIDRQKTLSRYYKLGMPVILYESFERINATLDSIEEIYGADHQIYLGAELTKMHERHYRGTINKIKETISKPDMSFKGELMIVIGAIMYEQGLDPLLKDDQVVIDAEELANTLNKTIQMKDKQFKDLMRKITGMNQMEIARILSRVRPKKRKLDEIDDILRKQSEE